ncbi:vWA domain-containing protein [Gracilibacillus xinjiangensis]|uniref:VWA domain-containing protein n=1 Tax=Gracilibacillus xinjiangensis TaxID=1193282 RepID=A0ABV8WU44_9BACI
MTSKFSATYLIFGFLFVMVLLVGCTSEESEDEPDMEEKPVAQETINENAENEPEFSNQEEKPKQESTDPLLNLLDRVPDIPSNIEEIIAYPVGPLAGNGDITGTEPIMEEEQKVSYIKEVLPAIEEDKEEAYLDQWWRAFHYLFAEEYPDPQSILKELNYTHFGNDALEDERFHFKDQINVLLVLDVSGSMANEIDGKSMLQMAKDSIYNFTSGLPDEANIGVRVYGHEGDGTELKKEESCQATELIYDFQQANTSDIRDVIEPLKPKGWTPIGRSLEQATEDFSAYPGENNTNLVYIVSDGIETCEGDPVTAAKELADSNIQSIVNVIGFNVGIEGQSHLREIAEAGGGIYTNAGNEDELREALGRGEALIQQWKEWKKGEIRNVSEQIKEQESQAVRDKGEWMDLMADEYYNHNFILRALHSEGYINRKAYEYMMSRYYERKDLYKEIRENEFENLEKEIEKNYVKQLEKIEQEYDEFMEEEE